MTVGALGLILWRLMAQGVSVGFLMENAVGLVGFMIVPIAAAIVVFGLTVILLRRR